MPLDTGLTWLPKRLEWAAELAAASNREVTDAFGQFQQLANSRIDFVTIAKLDRAVQRYKAAHGTPGGWPSLRLAVLASSTVTALIPGMRIGALRRGLLLEVYEGPYGMYRQELADTASGLYAFCPEVVCFALDAQHLAGAEGAHAETALADLQELWKTAQQRLRCVVMQQTVLPVIAPVLGNNEERLTQSPAAIVDAINFGLRQAAAREGVYLLSVDRWAAEEGLARWFDPWLWNSSKQEVHPRVADVYGDQVGRLLAALRGRSAKCLVLDLDNTLWGGVIGDDGVEGIVLGQGTANGEAHLALQVYARRLSQRGVILAVCSKNDEANALAAFDTHPEMLLKRADIACFIANWQDKATNLREIAARLNLGLDALVFVDDNPAERALIRRELPMVAVPELPEDPSGYVSCLARAGYFEALDITSEDRERAQLYRANAEREDLRRSATDMDSYLKELRMKLLWSPFDAASLKRIVQLISKTNQFNLTTRRYTEADVHAMLVQEDAVTLQFRLVDAYGDNGMVSVVIARCEQNGTMVLDTWLMSCRVLGRQVEEATLQVLAAEATALGCTRLIGEYRPSPKNGMVRQHYPKLGFQQLEAREEGVTLWALELDGFAPRPTHIEVLRAATVSPATA